MEYKIYDIVVNYDDETRITSNSMVDMPAVEIERIAFSEETLYFSEDSQQKFISVSCLADTPIKRIDKKTGEIYFTRFSKETINIMVNKFIKEGRGNNMTWNHSGLELKGVYLVEHFTQKKGMVETSLFKNIPDGSWVTTYWVEDKELYNKLKNDPKFNGFSIEIDAKMREVYSKVDEIRDLNNEDEIDIIWKKISDLVYDKSLTEDEIMFKLKETMEKFN